MHTVHTNTPSYDVYKFFLNFCRDSASVNRNTCTVCVRFVYVCIFVNCMCCVCMRVMLCYVQRTQSVEPKLAIVLFSLNFVRNNSWRSFFFSARRSVLFIRIYSIRSRRKCWNNFKKSLAVANNFFSLAWKLFLFFGLIRRSGHFCPKLFFFVVWWSFDQHFLFRESSWRWYK